MAQPGGSDGAMRRFRAAVSDLFHDRSDFEIVGRKRVFFGLSLLVLAISGVFLVRQGLDLGIEFEGGTVLQVPVEDRDATAGEVRDVLRDVGEANARVSILSSGGDETVRVQTETVARAEVDAIGEALAEYANVQPDAVSVSTVGPTFGEQVTEEAVRALVFFLLAVLLYLALRFELKMAFASIVALFHDLGITIGVYAITGLEVTPATVIAVLTILGYSLYDTVVIFDKIKENAARLGSSGRATYSEVVNRSLNETLMRSLNTSVTTILPVVSLLVVGAGILGAVGIRDFAVALLVGLMAGVYSSIFIASPVLALLKEREPRYRAMRQRLEARAGKPVAAAVPATPAVSPSPAAGGNAGEAGGDVAGAGHREPDSEAGRDDRGADATARTGDGSLAARPRQPRRRKRRR
ncbi:MAG TPA: protein translocase subunit SecF [Acidimicrobiia bacterium]|nr:protein translocase subunit SecF [Acidimicrobiia bacterium]